MKTDLESIKGTLTLTEYPINLVIELTTKCNLRCSCCPYSKMKRPKGKDMSEELYRKIIDEIGAKSPKTVVWFALMGEPLMAPDIVKKIEYAKSVGIKKLCLNTNGVLMDREMSKGLANSGLDEILISIDGLARKTYDSIRCGGDLDQVEQNIYWLKQAKGIKPKIIVQFIVSDENRREEASFIEYWTRRGVTVKVRRRLGWGTGVDAPDLDIKHRDMPCPWLMRQMIILNDGTVAQCDADYEGEYSDSNINDVTVQEAWLNGLFVRRLQHLDLDFDYEPCKNCKDWQVGKSAFYS